MEELGFYVANLGRDWVILGYPWFKSYNPDFDWNSNILKGEEVFIDMAGYQSKHCLVITTIQVTQEEITKDKEEVLKTIPPQYHQHWKVFSKHTSYWFPPAWEEDHTIILKEGAPDTIDCRVYCQMEMELEATWQFIIEALAKRVHHRLQIAICIGTFLLEKEGWKTLTHHGLLHIKSMDSTQYIPSPPHWQHPWPLTRENLVHQNGHLVTLLDYLFRLLYADYHWDCIFLLSRSTHKALILILVLLHCDLLYHCMIRSDSSTPCPCTITLWSLYDTICY